MHYYQFHIGDYRAATAHLSNEEDLAFRRLLDMYYDTEQPIPLDTQWVSRRLRIGKEIIETVLADMFVLGDDGWRHTRCDAEIAHYHDLAAKNRENGRKGGRPKKPNGLPDGTQVEPKKTLTNNQEPTTINHKPKKTKVVVTTTPDGVSDEVWESFLAIRKAKGSPVTTVALDVIKKEAEKAGMGLQEALAMACARGWQGFKASWTADKQTATEERRNQMAELTRGLSVPKPKPFWSKPESQEVIPNVEPKRLL